MGGDGDDGRAQADRMAIGHPDCTVQSMDELYDRKLREKRAHNIGWPSCQTIRGLHPPRRRLPSRPYEARHSSASSPPIGVAETIVPRLTNSQASVNRVEIVETGLDDPVQKATTASESANRGCPADQQCANSDL